MLKFILVLQFCVTVLNAQDVSKLRNDYVQTKQSVNKRIQRMKVSYLQADWPHEKETVLKECSQYLFSILTEKIFPAWYGTPWDFNGTSRTPGQRGIACGSFVTFTLQDAGFKIPSRMYQQPSENIIKNLTSSGNIKRFTNKVSMDRIIIWI